MARSTQAEAWTQKEISPLLISYRTAYAHEHHSATSSEGSRVATLTFRRRLTIEWGHCDPAGIVFNPRFFEFFDTNSWMLFETALGVGQQDLASTYGIIGIALVDARANFLKPAKFGDTIEIASQVSQFRRSSFDVEHRLSIGGEIAVEGGETRVWAARNKDDPDKIAAAAIPQSVMAKFTVG